MLLKNARARWRRFTQTNHELANVIKAVSIIGGACVLMGAALVPASGLIALGAGAACATGLTALSTTLAWNDDRQNKKKTTVWTNKTGQKIKSTVYDHDVLTEADKKFSALFNTKAKTRAKAAKLCRKFNDLVSLYGPSLSRVRVIDPGPTGQKSYQVKKPGVCHV